MPDKKDYPKVRVYSQILKRGVMSHAYWRGTFFAVYKPIGDDGCFWRYTVGHQPTGHMVWRGDNRREAERVAKRLDAQDAKVWGSRHWRFGKRPNKDRAFYKAAESLYMEVVSEEHHQ